MADEPRHPTAAAPAPDAAQRVEQNRTADRRTRPDLPRTHPHPDDAVAFMLRLATGGYDDAVAPAAKDLKSLLGR
ncbi:hypothetical protein ACGF12_33580 [Kitasatospora sp. NPDC048296]|uniref:hypothetical protein n=1 Tax=Kitasatospora sp. NPDC048296 TaxID=3364048 RepID=UPI00371AB6E0